MQKSLLDKNKRLEWIHQSHLNLARQLAENCTKIQDLREKIPAIFEHVVNCLDDYNANCIGWLF